MKKETSICSNCNHDERRHFIVEEDFVGDTAVYSCAGVTINKDSQQVKCECKEFNP